MVAIIVTSICLFVFGLWYAWLEYERPIYPTYLAVVIGVGASMLGQVAMLAILYSLGYGLPGVLVGVAVPFILTGLPMAIAQEKKERGFLDEGNRRRSDTGELGQLRKGHDADA